MRSLLTAVLGVALLVVTGGAAQAASLVVPNELAATEGNFLGGFVSVAPSRFQQVYAASQFGSQSVQISQIAFRPNGSNSTPFTSTIGNIQIYLSTTSRSPDDLRLNFAENIGIDQTQVFSGSLTAGTNALGPTGGPKTFDIIIDFTNSFIYNPSDGNLLLDVKKFTTETSGLIFDSEATIGDSVSTLVAVGNANAVTADPRFTPNSPGAVTQFKVAPVPEPSSVLGTLTFGAFGAGMFLKRKHQTS